MASLESVRKRLEMLDADVAALERSMPPDAEELAGHVAAARDAIKSALAVFRDRDKDIRQTYGIKG